MSKINTLPTFGQAVKGEGGLLGAIMRGSVVNGVRQPDYALIVADAAAGGDLGKLTWGKRDQDVAGASSLTDGQANTAAMAKAKSPAALAARGLKIDGHADWYIPSRAEMWALRANVPELFESEWHWTSTQGDRDFAFAQLFTSGYSHWLGKDHEFRVPAVRRIHLYHSIA